MAPFSPQVQWLDSPELTVAISHMGISHPPGQPLYSALMQVMRWVPLATLPLRLMLVNLLLLWLSVVVALRLQRISPAWLYWLCLTLLLLAPATMLQLIRQELYALNLFLFMMGLQVFAIAWQRPQWRYFHLLAFIFMLSLANHTLLALSGPGLMLALLWWRLRPSWSVVSITWSLLAVAMGAAVWFYLPLRAWQQPPLNFGNPATWENFIWVAQAKLYQSYSHPGLWMMLQNFAKVLALYLDFLTPVGLLALLGWWYLYRQQPRWSLVLLCIVLSSMLVVVPNRTFDWDNPDLFGYLLPGLMLFFGLGVAALLHHWQRHQRLCGFGLAVWLAVSLIWHFASLQSYAQPQSAQFQAAVLRQVPYRQALSLGSYQTFSQLLYAQTNDGLRPDLCLSYRGEPRGLMATMSRCAAAPVWVEFSIDQAQPRQGVANFGIRDEGFDLAALSPQGWFFSPMQAAQAVCQPEMWQQQLAYWQSWPLAKHPALRHHLLLTHYLHARFYQARGCTAAMHAEEALSQSP